MRTFPVHILIVQTQGKKFTLEVNQGMPVSVFATLISNHTSISPNSMRIIYAGKELAPRERDREKKMLRDYGVTPNMTFHVAQRG